MSTGAWLVRAQCLGGLPEPELVPDCCDNDLVATRVLLDLSQTSVTAGSGRSWSKQTFTVGLWCLSPRAGRGFGAGDQSEAIRCENTGKTALIIKRKKCPHSTLNITSTQHRAWEAFGISLSLHEEVWCH